MWFCAYMCVFVYEPLFLRLCVFCGSTETVWLLASSDCPSLGGLEVMGSFPWWDGRGTELKQVGDAWGRCGNDNSTRESPAGTLSACKHIS